VASTGKPAGGEVNTNDEGITLLDDETEIAIGDDGDEDDESLEGEGEQDAEAEQRRSTRSQRRKEALKRANDRATALERELADLRKARPATPTLPADDADLVKPKEEDFPNDYLAFDRAMRAYETRLAIRSETRTAAKASEASEKAASDAAEFRQLRSAHESRVAAIKDRVPDYGDAMRAIQKVNVGDDLAKQLISSPKSELLAYYLGKNPEVLHDLTRMTPLDAARKIGAIETRLRGPKPKTVTKAGAPKEAPKGGTGGTPKALKDMSEAEYFAARAGDYA
jgi:hypothetical protein